MHTFSVLKSKLEIFPNFYYYIVSVLFFNNQKNGGVMLAKKIYKRLIRPRLFKMSENDAEIAHEYVMGKMEWLSQHPFLLNILSLMTQVPHKRLEQTIWGLHFKNPIGLAAGMDKYAKALPAFEALGFGFLEFGGITKDAEQGNPRPRQFRIEKFQAIVNRMKFNNDGADKTAQRLAITQRPRVPLFANIGKSVKTPVDDIDLVIQDYVYTAQKLIPHIDVAVINVTSPNTPGLRSLQKISFLSQIAATIVQTMKIECRALNIKDKPILIKASPDSSESELDDIIEVCYGTGIQGIIATNTTTDKQVPGTKANIDIQGGLSGPPLFPKSLKAVKHISKQVGDNIIVIGVGGIHDIPSALQMIDAGARLIQILTCLPYEGPFMVKEINRGIAGELKAREQIKTLLDRGY